MLQKGDVAPDFELTDQDGKTWSREGLQGQRFVLYFYPADDTPGCTKESCDFRDTYSEWQEAGYKIFGISPQGVGSKRKFADKYSLPFPLLADEGNNVAKAYGCSNEDGSKWKGIILKVKRSTFVIDENGIVEHALYGVNARKHVTELKEILDI